MAPGVSERLAVSTNFCNQVGGSRCFHAPYTSNGLSGDDLKLRSTAGYSEPKVPGYSSRTSSPSAFGSVSVQTTFFTGCLGSLVVTGYSLPKLERAASSSSASSSEESNSGSAGSGCSGSAAAARRGERRGERRGWLTEAGADPGVGCSASGEDMELESSLESGWRRRIGLQTLESEPTEPAGERPSSTSRAAAAARRLGVTVLPCARFAMGWSSSEESSVNCWVGVVTVK